MLIALHEVGLWSLHAKKKLDIGKKPDCDLGSLVGANRGMGFIWYIKVVMCAIGTR